MADIVTPKKRSEMMSGIRGKDTKPEILIRQGLFKRGFRYRLHVSKLPGKPDVVLSKYKVVIFINGCFFHGHGCSIFKWPASRSEFWRNKIESNKARDKKSLGILQEQGWRTLVLWECSTKGKGRWEMDDLLNTITTWIREGDVHLSIGEYKVE